MVDLAAIAAEFIDDGVAGPVVITHTAQLWRWKSAKTDAPNAWFFLTIDRAARDAIALAAKGGFGSVKVEARVGGTVWRTSVFPSKDPPGYFLPMKAAVRKAERLKEGDAVTVELTLNPASGR